MKKILVGIDGSKNSNRALMEAKEIGKSFKSEITLLHVVKTVDESSYEEENEFRGPLKDILNRQAKEIIDDGLEILKDYEHKVNTLVEKGNPGLKLIEVAEEGDYTAIVIGSRGLSNVSKLMLGSVSNKVVNNSDISVVVVK